ncbi:hypothetical protein C8J57DRAFT_1222811 [Mycena rebaudengoi]|nr:hypothetical protein C8J57DRAFT_1222811 [Mycena rebaudengoi]
MEIRKNDKHLCLHRIDVVIIAAVITILITVTAPSTRCAPQKSGDFTAIIEGGTAVGRTFDGGDGIDRGGGDAHMGRQTAMMDSDQSQRVEFSQTCAIISRRPAIKGGRMFLTIVLSASVEQHPQFTLQGTYCTPLYG